MSKKFDTPNLIYIYLYISNFFITIKGIKMLYQPKHYPTMAALRAAAIYAGNNSTSSNEVINNAEIFGYVNNRPYEAVIAFCELSETHYWVAGEVIPAHWL